MAVAAIKEGGVTYWMYGRLVEFDDLGFVTAYSIEIAPESPARGWSCPEYAFRRSGPVDAADFRSPWGTEIDLLVEGPDGSEWLGRFEAGSLRSHDGLYGTPDPLAFVLVNAGLGYYVNVLKPTDFQVMRPEPLHQVFGDSEAELLFLSDGIRLLAVDPQGVRWQSERLCLDDLVIEGMTPDGLRISGDFVGVRDECLVSPLTGEVIGGRRFLDGWPEGAA